MKVPNPRRLKSGTYFIQLRLNGESIPVSAPTKKECIDQARLIKAEYKAGVRAAKKEPQKSPTLKEAIDNYIEKRDGILSPSTICGYRVIQRCRLKSVMGKPISNVSDGEWAKALNEEAKAFSAKTVKNTWGLIRAVLKEETRTEPPKVKMPQVVPFDKMFLDPSQIPVFVQAVKGSKAEIPALLALSSLRKSEILALKWENVDLERRMIKVRGSAVMDENSRLVQKKENKNGTSSRNIPIMIDELYEALSAVTEKSGLVVTCHPNTIYRQVNQICEKNGLPKIGVHGLRHSFASLAYHLGVPERITMEIGGWADNQTMHKIYIHIARQDVSKYADKFKDYFSKTSGAAGE